MADLLESSSTLPKLTVFLDCEFTSFENPQLLSIGMITSSGDECYAELEDPSSLGEPTPFVLDHVVAQFNRRAHRKTNALAMGRFAGLWLLTLHATQIELCYDYHTDMDLLEACLKEAGLWTRLESVIVPTHVAYLLGDEEVTDAMENSWATSFNTDDIERHHALADARALRAGFLSMHGSF